MSAGYAPAAGMPRNFRIKSRCRERRIPTLKELIGLVRKSGDSHVRLNIETKIDPESPRAIPRPRPLCRFAA